MRCAFSETWTKVLSTHSPKADLPLGQEFGLTPFNHDDYEPGRRFYLFDRDGIEWEIVSYAPAGLKVVIPESPTFEQSAAS